MQRCQARSSLRRSCTERRRRESCRRRIESRGRSRHAIGRCFPGRECRGQDAGQERRARRHHRLRCPCGRRRDDLLLAAPDRGDRRAGELRHLCLCARLDGGARLFLRARLQRRAVAPCAGLSGRAVLRAHEGRDPICGAAIGIIVVATGAAVVLFSASDMSPVLRSTFLSGLLLVPVWALL